MAKTATYYVEGMHCPACEVLMKDEFSEFKGVKVLGSDAVSCEVKIKYTGQKPSLRSINRKIEEYGYTAYDIKNKPTTEEINKSNWPLIVLLSMALGMGFLILERLINNNVTYGGAQSIISAFILGLIASISSCAALVGGLLLSQAKAWSGEKFIPYIGFNLSRLVSFVVFGALLGTFGSTLQLSIEATFILVVTVSIVMIILGIQMTDLIPSLRRFELKMPSFITDKIMSGKDSGSLFSSILLGTATFFLPCTFTLAAQLEAIKSGSALTGATTMGAFALGTLPVLLIISFTSKSFTVRKEYSDIFLKVAGILVILFSLYTINNQLNVVGFEYPDIRISSDKQSDYTEKDLPPVVDGIQKSAITVNTNSYSPNVTVLRAGVPAEVTFFGQGYGCSTAVVSRDFWQGAIYVNNGEQKTAKFTPEKAGTYKYSCTMGMYTGYFTVI